MKKYLLMFCAALSAAACCSRSQTAEAALVGSTYLGTIPAADGPGIAVEITFGEEDTYLRTMTYLERDFTFTDEGRYTVEADRVILHPSDDEPTTAYRIEEGQLRMLDIEQQVIEGPLADYYILSLKTEK